MVMWCYSKPSGYYEKLKEKFGDFNLASYWGPLASFKSSEWIANAAEYTLQTSDLISSLYTFHMQIILHSALVKERSRLEMI